ncbi:unnamed protein product [Fusarium graminearum]|nr:unnamed protein product [Fusarium graminearum]
MTASEAQVKKEQTVADTLASVLPSDGKPWYKQKHLLKLNFIILSLWNQFMDHPQNAWLGFINAIYWFLNGVSFFIAAWTQNKYGRKMGLYIGYIFLVSGTILQIAAPNAAAFIAARGLLGCAAGWYTSGAPLLINEIAYPTHRAISSACFQCGFYLGSLISAWVTFGTRNYTSSWDWRLPSLMQILLPALAFPGFFMAPESPRWLASVDRKEDAARVVAEHHAGGDVNSPLVIYETDEIINTIKAEQEAHASASYADMLKTKGNRWRLLISVSLGIFSQWSGNGVVSYYLAMVLQTVGITSVTHQTLISACLQLRSRGFSVMWISGIVAGIFNMFVNPIALGSIGWKYYFTYIIFLIAFLVIAYFFYPETKGRTLEQMAYIFDGEDAVTEGVEDKPKVLSVELERKSG